MSSGDLTFGATQRLEALPLRKYTVATVPSAAKFEGCIIYVNNGAAGSPVIAFSDASNWKRVDTNANIAAS